MTALAQESESWEHLAQQVGHYTLPPERNPFTSLVVDLTHRCNMRCANCFIPHRNVPDMDAERLYAFLERLPHRTYIRLIGAEPTMRDDLPDIIRNVIRLGHKPSLTTNGLKMAHLDYCRELRDAGLKFVCISMNGADDDEVYKILDHGKYAGLKTRALVNAFKTGFMIHTGTIVAKGVNEHIIGRHVDHVAHCAREAGIHMDRDRPWSRVPVVLRIKNIGDMGRHMDTGHMTLDELARLAASQLNAPLKRFNSNYVESGVNYIRRTRERTTSLLVPYETQSGRVLIRLIDWTVNESSVSDPGNRNRGRVTADWQVAPFFEDIRYNELLRG